MAHITLSGVNKIYPGGTHAVHDVDLHIADGEFMIMVGPSGCAKSTILRMIAGLETPTTGSIEIGGRVVNDVAPKDRDIAMVFQSYALYPHMTVRDNMAFGLKLRRMPQGEIDTRVADAARILGLEHLLDRLPKAMSGGQRQRVAMGRAIVREPQAFLMDEPLSNLDAKLRVQMRTEIAKLHQRLRTTTVYVTHDQVEALTLGQRICILRAGVIQQVDTPFQVYHNPANVFVGGFIGSPGMNFLSGHLVDTGNELCLRLGDQLLPLPARTVERIRLGGGASAAGRPVIVGIRPEHLHASTAHDAAAIGVHVDLVEAMGAETYAYFSSDIPAPDLSALSDTQAASATLVARLDANARTVAGEQLWLRPSLEHIHLFDPQSMLSLLAPISEVEHSDTISGVERIDVGTTAPLRDTLITSTTEDAAVTAAPTPATTIANVFDAPVESGVMLDPLMPAAVGNDMGGIPRPRFAQQILGDAAASASAPTPRIPRTTSYAEILSPATEPDTDAEAAAASYSGGIHAHDVPPAPRRQGFAPRHIVGDAPASHNVPHHSTSGHGLPAQWPEPEALEPVPAIPRTIATDDAIDAAVESLDNAIVITPASAAAHAAAPSVSTFRQALNDARRSNSGS